MLLRNNLASKISYYVLKLMQIKMIKIRNMEIRKYSRHNKGVATRRQISGEENLSERLYFMSCP